MVNGKFKLSIVENAIFICVYTVFKAKTLSTLVKNGRKYLSLMPDSQKEKYCFHLCLWVTILGMVVDHSW